MTFDEEVEEKSEMEGMRQCLRLVVMMCTDWYPSLAVMHAFMLWFLIHFPGIRLPTPYDQPTNLCPSHMKRCS